MIVFFLWERLLSEKEYKETRKSLMNKYDD